MRSVLVCGGRRYADREKVYAMLDAEHDVDPIGIIIEGGASGADELARSWARDRHVHCATVDALWYAFRKSAGPKRNTAMTWLKPSKVIAFPGGDGTADMVRKAKAKGIAVTLA